MLHHDSRDAGVAEAEAKDYFVERHNARLTAGREECAPVLDQIERTGNLINDYLMTLGGRAGRFLYDEDEAAVLMDVNGGGVRPLMLHPHASEQAANMLGLPGAFMRRIVAGESWQRKIAAKIFSEFAERGAREKVLVRAVANEARGVLSVNYKRLDSAKILAQFLQGCSDHGAQIYRARADDTRFAVEAAMPTVFPVRTERNGVEYVSFGVRYSTSDFGDGADLVSGWCERVWCTNKAVSLSELRAIHLGKKLPDEIEWSRQTYAAETLARGNAVRDVVGHVLCADNVRKHLLGISAAGSDEIEADAVPVLLTKAALSKAEIEDVQKLLIQGDREAVPSGGLTTWKLSQAVSAAAREAEPRRRSDLEELAGKMIWAGK